MQTARRAAQIQPFEVMDVLSRAQALEAAGRHVIHMEIGEPDFTAPAPVVEAAVRAIRAGQTAYTPSLGIAPLREAIAGHYRTQFGVELSPARVAVTVGASGALLLVLSLYCEPGDEFLVPDPGYPAYRHLVRAFEGVVRPLQVSAESQFQPTLEMVRQAWGPRTRGVLLGSPANPTGTLVPAEEFKRIAAYIDERGGVLIVDEIYQGLVYGTNARTILGAPGEVVALGSFSKYFCMTGWRIGWAILPEPRVREMEKLAQHFFISAPTIAQHAAVAALQPESIAIYEERRLEFARRRDFFVPAVARAGLRIPARPEGAFYVYADCSRFGPARDFALGLLGAEAVAATPGTDFGANRTGDFVRLAYTRGMADLEEAAARLKRYCAGLGR
ncbi:MAG TPA: aminotransferase class I/II-fold pyridoxal phosphate-dependent enzyme [Burkholderiales bacterium]|nr:aminotransferase class I/II-fold pyridoxal phosphate-dependent enzyme [Burkholderiales bacterium]